MTAVFDEQMDEYVAVAERALADPDAWRGFCTYVESVCAMQADDRGFQAVLARRFSCSPVFEAKRTRHFQLMRQLVTAAQVTGRLRPEFTDQDLALLVMANDGLLARTAAVLPEAWRRPVAWLLVAWDSESRGAGDLPTAPPRAGIRRALEADG